MNNENKFKIDRNKIDEIVQEYNDNLNKNESSHEDDAILSQYIDRIIHVLGNDNLIKAIDELKEKIGIKKTIKDYEPDEKDFLDRLDAMCEQAFDDQCTGANPRYPLISEIKDMYLRAYYGK